MKKLLLPLLLLVSSFVYAQMPDSKVLLPSDIGAIKRAGVLVVAMNKKDSPPFFSGEGDKLRGLDVDIARRVGVMLGVPVEFRRDAESFAEVVEQVRTGRADIAISKLSVTGPRLQTVRFSQPYVKLRQGLLVNRLWLSQNAKGREPYQVIRDFDGKISFIAKSSYETFARANFPRATLVPETDWNVIIDRVMSGQYAAAYRDEFEIKKISFEKPDAAISTKSIVIADGVDFIAAAVRPDAPILLSVINHVIATEFSNIDTKKLMSMYKESK